MEQAYYDTAGLPMAERSRHWESAIGATYFSLQLQFRDSDRFQGALRAWTLGELGLSQLMSSPLCYRRLKQHLPDQQETYLVTVPRRSAIRFSQAGRDTLCQPGAFLLEHGQSPYEFSYSSDNTLWVLKVPGDLLRARLRTPDRYCALTFDAAQGAGWLFASYVDLIGGQLLREDHGARRVLGQHLVELLACALEGDSRVLASQQSAVRHAHLGRIERYVRLHLGDASLNPEQVAQACGISLRYLHSLYREQDQTFSEWLRSQRLQQAHRMLRTSGTSHSIARIAQQWGFADQAHFSRLYKRHYGCPPSQARN